VSGNHGRFNFGELSGEEMGIIDTQFYYRNRSLVF
jgi:hypothetical protein